MEGCCFICCGKLKPFLKIDAQSTLPNSNLSLWDFFNNCVLTMQPEDNEVFPETATSICQTCYHLLQELSEFLHKTKVVQQSLLERYYQRKHRKPKVEVSILKSDITQRPTTDCMQNDDTLIAVKVEVADYQATQENNIELPSVDIKELDTGTTSCKNIQTDALNGKKHIENDPSMISKVQEGNFKQKPEIIYCCEFCGQIYMNLRTFRTHVSSHKNVYKCEICKKSFTQKVGLRRHLPIHTGDHPFKCEICNKSYKYHSSFEMHKRMHSGKRDYQCEICGLSLVSSSHLSRHLRIHTREKRFGCSNCGRRFAERYNLVAHMKLHQKTQNSEKEQLSETQVLQTLEAVKHKDSILNDAV